MNQNNVLKYLLPIVALIVLGESVMLISRLGNERIVSQSQEKSGQTVMTATESGKQEQSKVYGFEITSDSNNLTLNKTGLVEVKLKGNSDRFVDAVNVYVKYNPEAFEISNIVYDAKLPKPTFDKVSTERGLIVTNFLISEPKGLKIINNETLTVMKFNITPKTTGVFNFEISTGNEMKESATMIVENATSQVLSYSSNKLTVNVAR